MAKGLHILVTGASGFVGQAFVRLALAKGHRVTALVRDAARAPAGCETLVHALGSGASFTPPTGIDAIAHLAQSRAYRNFPDDVDEMFRVNVGGAREMLMAAAQAKVSRFCLVSSGTVYEPFAGPLVESAPLSPPGYLGATKLAAEVMARPFGTLFPVSALRLFTPYGPGQTSRLIPDLIRRVRSAKAVTLPGEGGGMRFSPSYVDDVCGAILAAIEESWDGVINLAAPETLSIEEATRHIGKVLGKTPIFERNPSQTTPAPNVVPDLTKFGQRYDISRFRSFAQGVAATLAGEP